MTPFLVLLALLGGPTTRQGHIDSLLTAGDTARAISELRAIVRVGTTPAMQCRLAKLLTGRVTDKSDDWPDRAEAQDLFETSVRHDPDASCLLGYAQLRQKQHLSIEASRLAARAFDLLRTNARALTPAQRADFYYERARPIANWTRNFEHLVMPSGLAVSTPGCDLQGFFCEAYMHPADFAARLELGTKLDGLVDGPRHLVRALLDSALAIDPTHPGALRLALRGAMLDEDWLRFRALALRAHRADTIAAAPLLAVLTSDIHDQRWTDAARVFDTLTQRMGPEAVAMYEGLSLIADSTLRDKLNGSQRVVYGEAIWGLSDPLYLTPYNERRLTHYARVTMADIFVSDAQSGIAGHNTEQGRLIIRYGMPEKWFEVQADRSQQLTEDERQSMDAMTSCQSVPGKIGPEVAGGVLMGCGTMSSAVSQEGGGRWSFWYYPHLRPLIFERSLGYWTAHHMDLTQSRSLDSAMYRSAPSTFTSPYANATIHALVTRFPRGQLPYVEVHAQASWARIDLTSDMAGVGVFLHDPESGQEMARYTNRVRVTDSAARFGGPIEVPWGRLRLAIEARTEGTGAAGQIRDFVTLNARPAGLSLSDILLGDSASAPATIDRREDVVFYARPDSLYGAKAPVALYWEAYGMSGDTTGRDVHYRVRVTLEDAGGRLIGATIWRGATGLLGLHQDGTAIAFEGVRTLKGDVLPLLLQLTAPNDDGRYRVNVSVTDLDAGRTATTARIVELK